MATTNKTLLIFVPTYPVRSETFIQREILELSKVATNYQVQVLSLRPGPEKEDSHPGVSVSYQRISFFDIFRGFFVINWSAVPNLLTVAVKNYPRSIFSNLYLFLKSIGYSFIARNMGASHIHAHFMSESSTLMYYVSELLELPFSISAHARDVFATSTDITAIPELVKQKSQKAVFVVVCNKKAWEKCKELAGKENESKILLHYHGLDPNLLPARSRSGENQGPFSVISVGRLVEKKGFTYLIDAAKILREWGLVCHINIIGPGPLYNELTEKITANQLGDSITVLGGGQGMSNTDVLKYMSEADAFVLPSIETSEGDAEGIPNTLVEAAFLKLPIISTTSGSIPEFITNNENGLLVPPKSAPGLANGIKYLMENKESASNMGQKAFDSASRNFDLTKNIHELDSLFSENLA